VVWGVWPWSEVDLNLKDVAPITIDSFKAGFDFGIRTLREIERRKAGSVSGEETPIVK
jgi:hypothetical protein